MKQKKHSVVKTVLRVLGIILATVLVLVIGLLTFLSVAEYRPEDRETVAVEGTASQTLSVGDTVTVMSWNIGYAALGEDADFFLDGGTMVRAESVAAVETNMKGIFAGIDSVRPDILLLQEADQGSTRSCMVDEVAMFRMHQQGYSSAFANNYKVAYVPYPLPTTLGTIDAGIVTFSAYGIADAQRVQLPVPFSWPLRTINLKRCVLITRIPIVDSDKELVLVNLHLEAYDDGEGKLAQTKMLAELLNAEAEKGNYVVAGGDFNQIFSTTDASVCPLYEGNWEAPVIDVTQFGEGWSFLMDESVPSCRLLNTPYKGADHNTFQYYIIDGFIVSANLRVESLETQDLGFVHADHNPLVLKVALS